MNLFTVIDMLQTSDKSTVLKLIQQNGHRCDCILKYCPSFQNDIDVVREAISFDPRSIQYASIELKNHFALDIVSRMGRMLAYMSEEMRQNRQIVLEAVRNDGMAILYSNLLDDDITDAAIQQNPFAADLLHEIETQLEN